MRNFFHAENEWGWDRYADGRLPSNSIPPFEPINIERLFEERIVGCHSASLIFSNILRLLNIPAIDIREYSAQYGAVHSVTYLPTLQRFVHGDHIADMGAIVPLGRVLIPLQDFIGISTYDDSHPEYGYTNYVDGFKLSQMGIYKLSLKREGSVLRLEGGTYLPCDNKDQLIKRFTECAPEYAPFSIVDSNMHDTHCVPGKTFSLKSQDVPIKSLAQLSIGIVSTPTNLRLETP